MAVLTDYFAATATEFASLDPVRGPVRERRMAGLPRKVPASKPGLIARLRGEKPSPERVEMPSIEIDSEFDVVSTTGIDPAVNMATLEAILSGEDADSIIEDGGVDVVATGPDETTGPWVYTVREQVIDALAGLPADALTAVAQQWLATEELAGTTTVEVLERLLRDFVDLASRAVESERSVYCWMSL